MCRNAARFAIKPCRSAGACESICADLNDIIWQGDVGQYFAARKGIFRDSRQRHAVDQRRKVERLRVAMIGGQRDVAAVLCLVQVESKVWVVSDVVVIPIKEIIPECKKHIRRGAPRRALEFQCSGTTSKRGRCDLRNPARKRDKRQVCAVCKSAPFDARYCIRQRDALQRVLVCKSLVANGRDRHIIDPRGNLKSCCVVSFITDERQREILPRPPLAQPILRKLRGKKLPVHGRGRSGTGTVDHR